MVFGAMLAEPDPVVVLAGIRELGADPKLIDVILVVLLQSRRLALRPSACASSCGFTEDVQEELAVVVTIIIKMFSTRGNFQQSLRPLVVHFEPEFAWLSCAQCWCRQ